MALGHLASRGPLDQVFDVLRHVRPIVAVFGRSVGLVLSKVAGKRATMNFSKYKLTCATPWYTQSAAFEQVPFLQ